ncbi:hypothetical protein MP228_012186 [Amoeboaphelidium protococcarum]|nr:hypothetical protein MP228_012186 [Amoeboaphelidium protococcarum]
MSVMKALIKSLLCACLVLPYVAAQDQGNTEKSTAGGSNDGLAQTVIISLISTGIGLAIFLLLKDVPTFHRVYRFRERLRVQYGKPPALASGPFRWLPQLISMSDHELERLVSVDQFTLLQFLKWSVAVLCVLSFFGLVVLIPVNATAEFRLNGEYTATSIQNVADGSSRLWAHVVFGYLFVGILFFGLIVFLRKYRNSRVNFLLSSIKRLSHRSLLISGLDERYQSSASLKQYISSLLQVAEDQVERIVFLTHESRLEQTLKTRFGHLTQLEKAVSAKHKQNKSKSGDNESPSNPISMSSSATTLNSQASLDALLPSVHLDGKKAAKFDENVEKFKNNDGLLAEQRRAPQNFYTDRIQKGMSAIVTFKSCTQSLLLSQAKVSGDPLKLKVSPVYEPNEMIWNNLKLNQWDRQLRGIGFIAAVIAITIFWAVPIGFVSSFLSSIDQYIPTESWPNWIRGLVQGTLPALVVIIFLSLVPAILALLAKIQGAVSKSRVNVLVFKSFYFFNLFNVLLVVTIAGTAVNAIVDILNNPSSIASILATSLPNIAQFFINFIVLSGIGAFGLSLANIGGLVVSTLLRFLCKSPRDYMRNDLSSAGNFAEAVTWVMPVLIWNLTMVYMIISPLILPFSAIYFAQYYLTVKYHAIFVNLTEYELGGKMMIYVVPCFMVGFYLFSITLGGLLLLKKFWVGGALVLALLAPILVYNLYLNKYVLPYCKYLTLDDIAKYSEIASEKEVQESKLDIDISAEVDQGVEQNYAQIFEEHYAYKEFDCAQYPGLTLGHWRTYEHPARVARVSQLWI